LLPCFAATHGHTYSCTEARRRGPPGASSGWRTAAITFHDEGSAAFPHQYPRSRAKYATDTVNEIEEKCWGAVRGNGAVLLILALFATISPAAGTPCCGEKAPDDALAREPVAMGLL